MVRNGMMVWSMATYVEHPSKPFGKLPYFVELVPHLSFNDGGGTEAVWIMMKKWRFSSKPHIVVDRYIFEYFNNISSDFGSFSLFEEINAWRVQRHYLSL